MLKQMLKAYQQLTANKPAAVQRVVNPLTSKGETPLQRVTNTPIVTTSTNPTAPATHKATKRTHGCNTRNTKANTVPAIINPYTPRCVDQFDTKQLHRPQHPSVQYLMRPSGRLIESPCTPPALSTCTLSPTSQTKCTTRTKWTRGCPVCS